MYHMEVIMEKQQNNLREEELEKMDLLAIVDDIWRGLKRFWLLCIVVVATCAIVSAFAVIIAFTPTYEAYSTFVVNSKTATPHTPIIITRPVPAS